MGIASNLGFPRVGVRRELKKALENYWSGKSDEADLLAAGKTLWQKHWTLQKELGMEHIPSNDFSFYDHVLDTAAMVGAVSPRYGWSGALSINSRTLPWPVDPRRRDRTQTSLTLRGTFQPWK